MIILLASFAIYRVEKKTDYYSQYLLIGKCFKNMKEIVFSYCDAYFTNLEDWLVVRPFSINDFDFSKPERVLTHKWPDSFQVRIDGIASSIETGYYFQTDGDMVKTAIWKSLAYIRITPDIKQPLEWYVDIFRKLKNFLTLLIGEPTYMTYLIGYGDNIEEMPGRYIRESVEIYLTEKKPNMVQGIHPLKMILPYPNVRDTLEKILSNWFAKAEKLKHVFDLFFGTFYNPQMYLEFHFLGLTQAIESYHRATKSGKYMSDEKWLTYSEKLGKCIGSELKSDHRNSLKSKIKYGNEYSLRKRFGDLLRAISSDTKDVFQFDDQYFKKKVVDTRNYFTHYDDELKENCLKGYDLIMANSRLKVLLILLLLKEIGIDEENACERLRNNYRIMNELNIPLFRKKPSD